ncbi:unnamed protein product [Peronospora belbahrii]|uniref:Uncharacterized protein n=1 Tax=Peronospora belbahrii TaxID=622444 RepID=A0ABN8D8G8_9STRA|nr:unnamed protein product [Peronospora belbahrii]
MQSHRRAKAIAVAFGVVIAIMLGLVSIGNRPIQLEKEDDVDRVTRYLQSVPADATERESQSAMPVTMPPANTPSTTPAQLTTREDEQGNNTTDLAELDDRGPAINNSAEAKPEEVKEEKSSQASTAAASRVGDGQVGKGTRKMLRLTKGNILSFLPFGVHLGDFNQDTISDNSHSDSDSFDCSSDDSVDSGSGDSDDSGSKDSDSSDSSDIVGVSCTESAKIMNRW